MIEKQAIVRNAHGIHCRPSAMIVTEAWRYPGQIEVAAEGGQSDLRSLLTLVSLGLQQGAQIRIRVTGPDEEQVCRRLVELFETNFDFPTVSPEERDRAVERLVSGR